MRLPRNRDARLAVLAVAALGGVAILAALADAFVPSPSGPRSSAYATSSEGLAAWAELARRDGRDVRTVRTRPAAPALAGAGTAVVLDPDELSGREAAALRRFALDGGSVVAGGRDPGPWLDALTGGPAVTWERGGSRDARADTGGARAVRTAGEGHWETTRRVREVVGGAGGTAIAGLDAGRGRILLVADPSPLQNRLLGEADNAALALALAGDGPVIFVEGVHGYGAARGVAALPARLKWALWMSGAAFLVLILARWRRFGAPEPPRRALPPPRRAYVDSLGATLARGRQAEAALAGVRAQARARLARRSGLGADADPAAWRRAGEDAGLDPVAAAALAGAVGDDVTAPGRALARLGGPGNDGG